jgi:hypothetical protein
MGARRTDLHVPVRGLTLYVCVFMPQTRAAQHWDHQSIVLQF